ncbi:HpcH/HpaI aldolase/citrate lyase family protein [Castellaniella sp.]|uniref:HpcH/HpaI aldolase family protein n=1 Tax=Castellaniella sp. TaxID=1955812 RepID=UPI00355EE98A
MVQNVTLRQRIRDGSLLMGSFVKTPAYQIVEVMGAAGLDFLAIDAEHAPFGRKDIDACMLAARAWDIPALVRLSGTSDASVLEVLDTGAAGIISAHAQSAAAVRKVVRATRYRDGSRGFSASHRAGGYGGVGMAEYIDRSDRNTVVICQIEDRAGVEQIEDIVTVDEVDCLFLGMADLAVSLGVDGVMHEKVQEAVKVVTSVCRQAHRTVGMFLPDMRQLAYYKDLGVRLFIIGSDQSVLRGTLGARIKDFRSATAV